MTLSSLSLLNLNNNNNAFSDSHQSPCSSVQYIYTTETRLTHDENIRYILHIILEQQDFSAFIEAGFHDGMGRGEQSSVAVDIPENTVGCYDVKLP